MKIVVLIVRLLLALVFFRLRPECPSAIPQEPYTRRPRRTGSSGSISVALWVGDRRSAGGWRRAAADQSLCSAGALTILGPVIVNILLYHLLLNDEGIGGALIVAVFWFVLFFHYRQYFSGIFTAKASSAS
jgi:putative oxidoreductase